MKKIALASMLSFLLGYAISGVGAPTAPGIARAQAVDGDAARWLRDPGTRSAIEKIAERKTRRILRDCQIKGRIDGVHVFGYLDC